MYISIENDTKRKTKLEKGEGRKKTEKIANETKKKEKLFKRGNEIGIIDRVDTYIHVHTYMY